MAIQVRLERNALTPLPSYRIRFVPHHVAGREDIAADIALRHPNFSKDDILTILNSEDEVIALRLLNGEQVTKEGCCTWFPSFTGSLDSPEDPMPPLDECLHVHIRVSPPFVDKIRQEAHIERLPMSEKLPVITSAEDTVLGLKDVLRSDGMLRITGSNLLFDRDDSVSHCLIEGTHNGSAVQTRVGTISNTEIILMPDVPGQAQPWQNEYRLSLTTHYTENGTPRTGVYKQMLRTPLTVHLGDNPGILSGSSAAALVTVSGGSLNAEEARVRIQVTRHPQDGDLRFRLLDMKEGGKAGDDVRVAADGVYTLLGWTDSDVTSLEVTVADYAALFTLVRNTYAGRLVDVLDITMGT